MTATPAPRAAARGPSKRDAWLGVLAIGLVFAEHLLFGATRDHLVLIFAMLHLAMGLAMLAHPAYRRRANGIHLGWVGVPYGILLLVGLSATLPLGDTLASGYWQLAPASPGAISVDPWLSRLGVVQLAGHGSLFLVGVMLAADERSARRLLATLMVAALAFSVWAFVEYLVDPRSVLGVERQVGDRLAAAFGSANTAATLFGSFIVVALILLFRNGGRSPTDVAVPLLLMLFAGSCLVLTASRGGVAATLVATAAGLTGTAWLARRSGGRRSRMLVGAIVGFAVLTLLFALSGEQLVARSEAWAAGAGGRAQMNALLWSRVLEAPLFGHGIGSFWSIAATSVTATNAETMFNARAAHNFYLQWLLQTGFVGGLAVAATLAAIAWRLLRGLVVRQREQRPVLAIACVMLLFLIHAAVDYTLEVPSMAAYFALLLGIGFAMATPTGERRIG